jgi:hypothetical protein
MGAASPTRQKYSTSLVMVIVVGAILSGCMEDSMNSNRDPELDAAIRRVRSMSIYFGHQSVGTNVVDGLSMLGDSGLSIVEIHEGTPTNRQDPPVFFHSQIGENYDPDQKIHAFGRLLRSGLAEQVDIAFMKFCYVDTDTGIEATDIFFSYVSEMERLEAEYPDTVFVYTTMPLMSQRGGIKELAKRLLARETSGREGNIERNRFNELLRNAKADTGRLFDIAMIESIRPDGSRQTFGYDGQTYEAMTPAYTSDGGHLNQLGRRVVAEKLVLFLAGLGHQ